MRSSVPAAGVEREQHQARGDAQDENAQRDDQGAGPRQLLPVRIGAQGKLENHHRQVGDGSCEIAAPELVVERREQQWRGLATDARHRQQQTCEDAAAGGGVDRSEEHTSELQSQSNLVCRLLLETTKQTLTYS